MEYLDAVGSLLLFLLVGLGIIAIGFLVWRQLASWSPPSLATGGLPSFRNFMRADENGTDWRYPLVMLVCVAIPIGILLYSNSYRGPKGEIGEPGIAGPPGPSENAVRTATSTSCARDGCPVSCTADESIVTAYCVGGGGARLSDTLLVGNGVTTAKCGPTASSILLYCLHR